MKEFKGRIVAPGTVTVTEDGMTVTVTEDGTVQVS